MKDVCSVTTCVVSIINFVQTANAFAIRWLFVHQVNDAIYDGMERMPTWWFCVA